MAGITAIGSVYCDVDAASIEVASIPTTYQHLWVNVSVRSVYGGTGGDYFYIRFNGETSGSNYAEQIVITNNTGATALNASGHMQFRRVPTDGTLEPAYGGVTFYVPDYANTSKKGCLQGNAGSIWATSSRVAFGGGMITNTDAAIATITVICANGNVKRGSSMTVYGLEDA